MRNTTKPPYIPEQTETEKKIIIMTMNIGKTAVIQAAAALKSRLAPNQIDTAVDTMILTEAVGNHQNLPLTHSLREATEEL